MALLLQVAQAPCRLFIGARISGNSAVKYRGVTRSERIIARMQITVNGTATEIPDGLSMAGLIDQLQLNGRRLAVEINEALVPRSLFESHRLAADDRVEIIHAVGGG